MKRKIRLTRRSFIRRSTAAGAATLALGASNVATGARAKDRVNLGLIGCGGRGAGDLLPALVRHCKDARIAAVCDIKKDRISKAQRKAANDKPKGYTDFRKMLDVEKLDGVLVATEVANHAKIVIPVLEAGLHCFSEKPMDCTVEKVDAITKAARKAKGLYQMGTQRRYHPGFLGSMKLIHSGKLGKITFMQGHWHWDWHESGWVVDVEMSGGELVEQAVHHLDAMSWAMKDQHPLKCVSMGYRQVDDPNGPKIQTEDHSATAFEFPGGVIFSYTQLFRLPQFFTDEKLWVFCERAGIDLATGMQYGRKGDRKRVAPSSVRQWNEKTHKQMVRLAGRLAGGGERAQQEFTDEVVKAAGKKDWNRGTTEELLDFVDNIKTGGKRTPSANVETGRVSTLMAIMGRTAMYNSAKNAFDPRVIRWEDLGSTSEPSA